MQVRLSCIWLVLGSEFVQLLQEHLVPLQRYVRLGSLGLRQTAKKDFLLDIVGRYHATIKGKTYDTVCVMDIETYVHWYGTIPVALFTTYAAVRLYPS